ncbi:Gibberellin receptor GID1B [Cytospora mali]|uniref:Gibberellin receptor GID1B n=1 Tax=Cytospora mali TaxID=578113 RepID=A0A194UNP1_CYTMA|nr:Gibberellin receptor GID1B [Valsa mali var. pyri (nom. inval.)]
MAQLSFLAYWRLKVPVILLRILTVIKARAPLRRDRLLAETEYSARCERLQIPSRDPGRFIAAELYLPPPSPSSSSAPTSPPRPTPILVNYHGSGFVLTRLLGTNSVFCARAAHDLGIPVLDADYRKAPEHPFPAALHDVEDVLHWVGGRSSLPSGGDGYRLDASRVVLSGFSSGGALALAAASASRREILRSSGIGIRGVVALYPLVDLTIPSKEKFPPREGISPMDPRVLDLFVDCYLPDQGNRVDPRASPGKADPAEYPGTVAILSCEGDRLAPEALALGSRLGECPSVKAVNTMLMGVGHGFDAGVEQGTLEWEKREEMYALAVETVKGAIGKT